MAPTTVVVNSNSQNDVVMQHPSALLSVPTPPRLEKVRSTSTSSADTARTSISTTLEDLEESEIKASLLLEDDDEEEEDVIILEKEEDQTPSSISSNVRKNVDQATLSSNNLKASAKVEPKVVRFQGAPLVPSKSLPATRSTAAAKARTKAKVKAPTVVRFGDLSVHEFPCGLGDHPSVKNGGPPIRLEYNSAEDQSNGTSTNRPNTTTKVAANPVYSYTLPLEDYEFSRPQRRTLPELLVPADTRREWLLQEPQFSAADLARAERSVQRVQRQRNVSQLLEHWEDWQLAYEAVRRWWQRRRLVKKSSSSSSSSSPPRPDDNEIVAHEWCRQHKEQKLAERRERRLQKAKSASF